MSNSILVVGGGFAGLTAAIEAAELGHDVYIVEKSPYLGGRVAQLNKYFPTLCGAGGGRVGRGGRRCVGGWGGGV